MSYAFLKNDQFWIVFGLISRLLRNAHFLTCLVVWHIDLHYLILNKHPEINSKQSINKIPVSVRDYLALFLSLEHKVYEVYNRPSKNRDPDAHSDEEEYERVA